MERTKLNGFNPFVDRIRSESVILNARLRGNRNDFFNETSVTDLESRIVMIQGSGTPENPEKFWDPERQRYEISYLPGHQNNLKSINKEFESYIRDQLSIGNRKPETVRVATSFT